MVAKLERQAKENAKMATAVLKKANAATTRANIIRRIIKGARGRKHMAVH
jgi:hypothetical protein